MFSLVSETAMLATHQDWSGDSGVPNLEEETWNIHPWNIYLINGKPRKLPKDLGLAMAIACCTLICHGLSRIYANIVLNIQKRDAVVATTKKGKTTSFILFLWIFCWPLLVDW